MLLAFPAKVSCWISWICTLLELADTPSDQHHQFSQASYNSCSCYGTKILPQLTLKSLWTEHSAVNPAIEASSVGRPMLEANTSHISSSHAASTTCWSERPLLVACLHNVPQTCRIPHKRQQYLCKGWWTSSIHLKFGEVVFFHVVSI